MTPIEPCWDSHNRTAEIVQIYEHAKHHFGDGRIFAGDETTEVYSLSKDPILRADELKLIDYARA